MTPGWWSGRRVLITGHTGFKGAWLSLWLATLGARVYGFAHAPVPGSLFVAAQIGDVLAADLRGDIRDADGVKAAIDEAAPELTFHLAAQPLVRESYEQPLVTFETNVMGTANVVMGAVQAPTMQAIVSVTTDKVYRNLEQRSGYRETDPLGGDDPYSASKACAELVTHSIASSFRRSGGPRVATARAGNVLGGGDIARDRLLPDVIHALETDTALTLRYPDAVRPWQHVLDPLAGYLILGEHLFRGDTSPSYNFGPEADGLLTVAEITEMAFNCWGCDPAWTVTGEDQPHEAGLLALDTTLANDELGWRPRLTADQTVRWTVEYAKRVAGGERPRRVLEDQIERYQTLRP